RLGWPVIIEWGCPARAHRPGAAIVSIGPVVVLLETRVVIRASLTPSRISLYGTLTRCYCGVGVLKTARALLPSRRSGCRDRPSRIKRLSADLFLFHFGNTSTKT